ncbi:MAG: 1-deoxy-D-xylulose-5-phosphate synthase [Armatimonadota bacterium]
MARILDSVNDPADLKGLSVAELKQLAEEIRGEIIENIANVGGHFAPNLGSVEITLALHSVLSSPKDKIVWDVGHQTYPHKLVTGRRERFHTIKQLGGISGYCKRAESPHDHIEAGHGGTSISAALGFAVARDMRGTDETVVAVIGDGSLTTGLAQEALNNAGSRKDCNLVILLNDNSMSIAPNVGAISDYLGKIRAEPHYLWAKREAEHVLHHLPLGDRILDAIGRVKDGVKQLVVPGMLFEELGFTYLGPLDGHCIESLQAALVQAQRIGGPVVIHAVTQKGKGYAPAEADPFKWHATSPFDPKTGEAKSKSSASTYSKVFAKTLIHLANNDRRIVGITAAMPDGTGLLEFQKIHPDRFIDVSMAEQHAVTFAAGLAAAGMRPVCAIYSTFLQRAYDEIIHDVCIMDFPVVFAMDRGGLAGDDGPTHQGVFDIAYMRSIPNMVLMAPKDEPELQRMLATAVTHPGPIGVRYPRGGGPGAELLSDPQPLPIGVGESLREGDDVAIIGFGYGVTPALQAAELLAEEGIQATVINARFCKPLDTELILEAARRCGRVITVEDGVRQGGFGSAVLEMLQDHGCQVPVRRLGIPDRFIEHGKREKLLELLGLDGAGVARSARELVRGIPSGEMVPDLSTLPRSS